MENNILTGYSSNEVTFISESDLMVFLDAIENPREPNENLINAYEKYKKNIENNSDFIKLK